MRRSHRVDAFGAACAVLRMRAARSAIPSRAHSSLRSHQLPARHPHVAQCEQRDDLRRVVREPPVPYFREPELALEHPEQMLDLGADAPRIGGSPLVDQPRHAR